MKVLYPPIEPYATRRLRVADPHELYVEECGNPQGVPVVFLHGGPGSGCRSDQRRFFDPAFYRIVLFDQRGSGRSVPAGHTGGNTTQDLITDIEAVRRALRIDRWVVFGGSWGAALTLLYTQRYPELVRAMVLRGVFLARRRDLEWFFGPDGVARLFPEAWSAFADGVSPEERREPVPAYHRRVHDPDERLALAAARAWSAWTDHVATWTLPADGEPAGQPEEAQRVLAKARIETHFARHGYFISENGILDRAHRLAGIPCSIAHGRRDLTCTMEAAWLLHRAVPGSSLSVVSEAGHLASEPAMIDALVSETDRMRAVLEGP